jgi:transketolase
MNNDLRREIVNLVYNGKDGHIPSSLSIVDMIDVLYGKFLKVDPKNPAWPERDYFVLSKGHGCVALYVTLHKYGFLTDEHMETFCREDGILGEHPDCTVVPGVEASTGSLGHGFPFAVGIALGLKIRNLPNRVFVMMGDGECHEGTVWEAANVAHNRDLGNMCVLVDWNGSAAQLMPKDDLPGKWRAFGWNSIVIDGHDEEQIANAVASVTFQVPGVPTAIVARTTKGKGLPFIEGHGQWHHRIPTPEEYNKMMELLR